MNNAETIRREFKSLEDEDWELDSLLQHFGDEMRQGNILVFQMTEKGIQHSWRVDVRVGIEETTHKCFRKAVGYIEVMDNQLYSVDYDCLTMAAQFEKEKVPDQK